MRRHLRNHLVEIAIALAAIAMAIGFVVGVLRHTRPFGLPLDDAYIYLTYAKQFGRGQPFSYFPGGGYSAGSTSVLWPMVLAPFWTLGARGHALVWMSFGVCTALYAATCIGMYRLVRGMMDSLGAGLAAAGITLAIPAFAWTSLAGMEVGFAAALLVALVGLLARAPTSGPPGRALGAVLAATSLSRPESTLLVGGICGLVVLARLHRRDFRAAAWWAAPLAAPLAWVIANKLLAGHWFPNTGIAKSHFYLPGFDTTYWWDAITKQTKAAGKALFLAGTSPLIWPKLFLALWFVGAARVVLWARRERRYLVGFVIVAAPWLLVMSVIASSGQWEFHNYRYIAPAFPLFAIPVACALAPPPSLPSAFVQARRVWLPRIWGALVGIGVLLYFRSGVPQLRDQILLYAQNAADLNRQVVKIGEYLHAKLPTARVIFHDAGAVAYYGDTFVYDMLGLVTNNQAHVTNHGPGSRFEFLESLPPARRPTHFVYYPAWMGQAHFYGKVVLQTPLGPQFSKKRLIGGGDMQILEATWDHARTAELPLSPTPGWTVVDRLDIADLVSEAGHAWSGTLGRRNFGDPTAKWTLFHEETRDRLLLDGGRTIRKQPRGGVGESFTITVDPRKPVRLVMRTGGKPNYPYHEGLGAPGEVRLYDGAGHELGRATLAAPTGPLVEVTFELPPSAARTRVRVVAQKPYRVFHWFVLQPE